jgi:hypothetical protein
MAGADHKLAKTVLYPLLFLLASFDRWWRSVLTRRDRTVDVQQAALLSPLGFFLSVDLPFDIAQDRENPLEWHRLR